MQLQISSEISKIIKRSKMRHKVDETVMGNQNQ
jgi:hypothetical protein